MLNNTQDSPTVLVKIFSGHNYENVQADFNVWMTTHKGITYVKKPKLKVTASTGGVFLYTIGVFYLEKEQA